MTYLTFDSMNPNFGSSAINTLHPRNLIHVIGLGVSEKAVLSKDAFRALIQSELIIGSERQLAIIAPIIDEYKRNQEMPHVIEHDLIVLPKLAKLKTIIDANANKTVSVLASGDPLYYGIGRWINQHYNFVPKNVASKERETPQYREENTFNRCRFYPAISSIQAACHRLGFSLQDVTVISLHGRPIEKLRTQLKNNRNLLLLTDKYSHPQALAKECLNAQLEHSLLTVCEDLGYKDEKIRQFKVQDLLGDKSLDASLQFSPLHITLIQVAGKAGVLPEFPGIPDAHYITGEIPGRGMITKREVRLSILSLMQPTTDDVIWDIGAGCGGVSVELAFWNERVNVYAIEHHHQRLEYLSANQHRFGVVTNLHIIRGRAPDCLADLSSAALPLPNKIFIGGSDGELDSLLKHTWALLPEGGLLVVSTVVEKSRQQLLMFAQTLETHQVESVEISVKRGRLEHNTLQYAQKLPVEVFKFIKTGNTS